MREPTSNPKSLPELDDLDPWVEFSGESVQMRWYLKGPLGVVQFCVMTGWMPPEVEIPTDLQSLFPYPYDLGYHSPTPRYEGQGAMDCHLLEGGRCYYDGSGWNAKPLFDLLRSKGSDAVWLALSSYYKEVFGGRD